jgi:serine/threonine protein kinase
VSDEFKELLDAMICKDPLKRPTVDKLLDFEWFANITMLLAPPLEPVFGGGMGKMGMGKLGGMGKIGGLPDMDMEDSSDDDDSDEDQKKE